MAGERPDRGERRGRRHRRDAQAATHRHRGEDAAELVLAHQRRPERQGFGAGDEQRAGQAGVARLDARRPHVPVRLAEQDDVPGHARSERADERIGGVQHGKPARPQPAKEPRLLPRQRGGRRIVRDVGVADVQQDGDVWGGPSA